MKRCPITYEPISDQESYSQKGLHLLSRQLKNLMILNYSSVQQRTEALARAGKMSIQGVQLKLSAKLKIKEQQFELVDHNGQYILKPQSELYPELPENEALTMTLASLVGIEIPIHGLIYAKDSMTYFIKRFDRKGHNIRISVEDFTQLSGETRDTKYNSSMEKVVKIIENFCSFPTIEFIKLFKITLFNFLIGNDDMHLKNFSLITKGEKISLSPAYDLLNTAIVLHSKDEIALPLHGKMSNLKKSDFIDYFAIKHLNLNLHIITQILEEFKQAISKWQKLINISFLSEPMKIKYLNLLNERCKIFGF